MLTVLTVLLFVFAFRETRPGRRQGIDILVAMNQTDDFGDLCMNYSGLMDSMDYIEGTVFHQ